MSTSAASSSQRSEAHAKLCDLRKVFAGMVDELATVSGQRLGLFALPPNCTKCELFGADGSAQCVRMRAGAGGEPATLAFPVRADTVYTMKISHATARRQFVFFEQKDLVDILRGGAATTTRRERLEPWADDASSIASSVLPTRPTPVADRRRSNFLGSGVPVQSNRPKQHRLKSTFVYPSSAPIDDDDEDHFATTP